jgi:uncharacterized membrane protein
MNKTRMTAALATGALLGVVCIVGAQVRSGFSQTPAALFSLWYNRVIIGLVVGMAGRAADKAAAIKRGALLGLLVSFAHFAAVAFTDVVSFLAGVVYGVIIEWVCLRFYGKDAAKIKGA